MLEPQRSRPANAQADLWTGAGPLPQECRRAIAKVFVEEGADAPVAHGVGRAVGRQETQETAGSARSALASLGRTGLMGQLDEGLDLSGRQRLFRNGEPSLRVEQIFIPLQKPPHDVLEPRFLLGRHQHLESAPAYALRCGPGSAREQPQCGVGERARFPIQDLLQDAGREQRVDLVGRRQHPRREVQVEQVQIRAVLHLPVPFACILIGVSSAKIAWPR